MSGLSSVNLMRVVRFPLNRTLCKILQGSMGEMIFSGTSLYLGILLRVRLKSISMTVMRRLRESKMALT